MYYLYIRLNPNLSFLEIDLVQMFHLIVIFDQLQTKFFLNSLILLLLKNENQKLFHLHFRLRQLNF